MDANALGFLLWIPILLGIYVFWKRRQAFNAGKPTFKDVAPYDDGPMKVDIAFQEVPARTLKHKSFGGDNWWRMHMNIQISKQDLALFKQSGLMENELFSYPGYEFPEIDTSFIGHHLLHMPNYKDFPNISEAEAAKEKLIKSLHIIRGRLDDMKSSRGGGVDRESLEI